MNIFKITLLSSLVILNSCNKQSKEEKANESEAIEDVQAALDEMQKHNKKEIEENGMLDSNSKQLDKIISATDKLKGGESDEARLYQIIGKHMKVMQSRLARFEKDQQGVEEAIDLSTLHQQKNVAERIKLLDKAIKANQEFKKYATDEYYTNILKEVEATDLPSRAKKEFRVGFEGGGKKDKQIALIKIIRDTEIVVCETFKKQLTLLNDNMDKWSWDANTESVNITDPEVEKQYNANTAVIQDAAQKQFKTQREAVRL